MLTKITCPGIIDEGTRQEPTSWRGIKPGDEIWFFVTHGALGTVLGEVWWYLVNNENVLYFGQGEQPADNSWLVRGWPFPQTREEFELPVNQARLRDLLRTTQVLLSAVTGLATELDDKPVQLDPDWSIPQKRVAVLKFSKTTMQC